MHEKILLLISCVLFSQAATAAAITAPTTTYKDTNLTTTSNISPFTGFYGNMNVGWMIAEVKDEQHTVFDTSLYTLASSPRLRANSVTGGIGLGYSYIFKQALLLGIEGRANYESIRAHFEDSFDEPVLGISLNSRSNAKLDSNYVLLAKLGALLQPNTLIYLLAGSSWGKFHLDSKANISIATQEGAPVIGLVAAKDSRFETGFLLGLGMEYAVSNKVSIGLEYVNVNYSDLDFPNKTMANASIFGIPLPEVLTNSAEFNVKTNNILLKLNYYIA